MVILTVTRIAGIKWKGKLDSVWETYFIVVAAEIGLVLVAITAFRALYVSKAKSRRVQSTITTLSWYHRSRTALINAINSLTGKESSNKSSHKGDGFLGDDIPGATMTGMRTSIDENGRSITSTSVEKEPPLTSPV
jgi:hypothetical protein